MNELRQKIFTGGETYYYGEKSIESRVFSTVKKVAITVALAAIFSGSSMYFNQAEWMPFSKAQNESHGHIQLGKSDAKSQNLIATQATNLDKLDYLNDSTPGNTKEIVNLLVSNNENFLATAVIMESIKLKPYSPPEGKRNGIVNVTIGIGYCIPERIKSFGVEAVKSDFTQAGIPADMQHKLLAKDSLKNGSFITQAQAIKLLAIVAPYYQNVARSWLKEGVFDKLDKNQQAALTWLAYNVGQDNLQKFQKLNKVVTEISKSNEHHTHASVDKKHVSNAQRAALMHQFLHHITPSYVNGQGVTVVNKRVEHVMSSIVKDDYVLAMQN